MVLVAPYWKGLQTVPCMDCHPQENSKHYYSHTPEFLISQIKTQLTEQV